MEPNTLFESLMGKVLDNGELSDVLQKILFSGEELSYSLYDTAVSDARMYGFVRNDDGKVRISNRIFEMLLYNHFLATEEMKDAPIYKVSSNERSKFIVDGQLDMEHILKRYVECFDDIYGDNFDKFSEAEGTRRFLLFIRPIINGTGNYYIEAQTRSQMRTDVIIDYLGMRYIIELKIWRGKKK